MTTLTRKDYRVPIIDIFDWFETPFTAWRPMAGHPMRVEAYVKDGCYVVRAELPGLDPVKDLEVAVSKGVLTMKGERSEQDTGKHHSEFRYGTFARSVTLPVGADEEHIQAIYDKGILEVTVPVEDKTEDQSRRRIPVRLNQHIKPT
jgi:HSP20 family protein